MNKWIAYFLISIPVSFSLIKIIELKNEYLFWTYFGIMGISALVSRWFIVYDKKNKLLKMIEHVGMILTISLFMSSFLNWFLNL